MTVSAAIRTLHIVLAVSWAGSAFFQVLVLEPAMRRLGPDAGKMMGAMTASKLALLLTTSSIGTLLTGIYVFWWLSSGFESAWLRTPYAHSLMLGAATGILTFLMGLFVSRPTAEKLGRLAAAGGPEAAARIPKLANRLRFAARLGAVLLLISVLAMASARYV